MPILVGPVVLPPPVVSPPVALAPLEGPAVTWTDPAGTVTTFTDLDAGWVLQPGATGLDMPEFSFVTDESPDIDGIAVRQVRAGAKSIVLPVAFWCDDGRAAYLARRRALISQLNPKRGPGVLTVIQPDGETRSIPAYYASGIEGNEATDQAGMRWSQNALTFTAPSPYWLGEEVTASWRVAAGGTWLPILPLAVQDSQVLGAVTVTSDGDDDAYPVWTVTGPATAIHLANTSTGETLTLTHTLTGTDTVVIDTRQRQQTVTLNGVTNLWPDLSDDSSLWPLVPGINELTLEVDGATSATEVAMSYRLRYLAA